MIILINYLINLNHFYKNKFINEWVKTQIGFDLTIVHVYAMHTQYSSIN